MMEPVNSWEVDDLRRLGGTNRPMVRCITGEQQSRHERESRQRIGSPAQHVPDERRGARQIRLVIRFEPEHVAGPG